MAWYEGIYSCGHEGRVQIYGPTKDRKWKEEYEFSKLCPDCYQEHLQEKRKIANQEALEKAEEMELPKLTGSPKQVAWANTLRQNMIDEIDHVIERYEERYYLINLTKEQIKIISFFILENRTSASYYINNRFIDIFKLMKKEKKEALKSDEEKAEDQLLEEIKIESTVYPVNKISNSVVNIKVEPKKVITKFEYNEKFIDVVKDLGYEFERKKYTWIKEIEETTDSSEDRAAELGNMLLNAGFPILILEPEIRKKAIEGGFEPECYRWIYRYDNSDQVAITWRNYDDNLYHQSKSLPGAKWKRPSMLVKVNHYQEVEDFAECFGFRFTEKARQLIELHKEELKKAEVVIPVKVERKDEDGLKEILESGDEILHDLLDN